MNREELEAYILNHYSTEPDYPWADTPRAAVFRHAGNRKWFALIMEVPRDKLGLAGTEKLDIVDIELWIADDIRKQLQCALYVFVDDLDIKAGAFL